MTVWHFIFKSLYPIISYIKLQILIAYLEEQKMEAAERTINVQGFLNENRFSPYQWMIFIICLLIAFFDGMDTAAIGLSELANISDQRIQKLINPAISGLPAFLTKDPGLNSGMMIVQVASASLVSENKILTHPASVDSIPTSADKEDHVSMGTIAARKLTKIIRNAENVCAMELMTAAQALDFHKPLKPAAGVKAAYDCLRKKVSFAEVKEVALKTDKELIKNVNIFDVYEGDKIEDGKKSYSVSFAMQHADRTLTDEEINKVFNNLITNFESKLGAVIRK
mgnify:CR=1 FL=1